MISQHKLRLLIVDDHPVVREGLRSIIHNFESIELIAVCATAEDALTATIEHSVEVLLADLRMTPVNGIQLLRSTRQQAPATKVIVFSSYELEEDIYQALSEGACGFLNKYASEVELLTTITRVAAGERVFSRRILEKYDERKARKEITPREFEILPLMAKGLTNREIASIFGVSEFTIKNQIKSVCEKLEVSHRAEATRVAIERGLIVIDEM